MTTESDDSSMDDKVDEVTALMESFRTGELPNANRPPDDADFDPRPELLFASGPIHPSACCTDFFLEGVDQSFGVKNEHVFDAIANFTADMNEQLGKIDVHTMKISDYDNFLKAQVEMFNNLYVGMGEERPPRKGRPRDSSDEDEEEGEKVNKKTSGRSLRSRDGKKTDKKPAPEPKKPEKRGKASNKTDRELSKSKKEDEESSRKPAERRKTRKKKKAWRQYLESVEVKANKTIELVIDGRRLLCRPSRVVLPNFGKEDVDKWVKKKDKRGGKKDDDDKPPDSEAPTAMPSIVLEDGKFAISNSQGGELDAAAVQMSSSQARVLDAFASTRVPEVAAPTRPSVKTSEGAARKKAVANKPRPEKTSEVTAPKKTAATKPRPEKTFEITAPKKAVATKPPPVTTSEPAAPKQAIVIPLPATTSEIAAPKKPAATKPSPATTSELPKAAAKRKDVNAKNEKVRKHSPPKPVFKIPDVPQPKKPKMTLVAKEPSSYIAPAAPFRPQKNVNRSAIIIPPIPEKRRGRPPKEARQPSWDSYPHKYSIEEVLRAVAPQKTQNPKFRIPKNTDTKKDEEPERMTLVYEAPPSTPIQGQSSFSMPNIGPTPHFVAQTPPSTPIQSQSSFSMPNIGPTPRFVAPTPRSMPMVSQTPLIPIVASQTPLIPIVSQTPLIPIVTSETPLIPIVSQTPLIPIVSQTPLIPIVASQTPLIPIVSQTPLIPIVASQTQQQNKQSASNIPPPRNENPSRDESSMMMEVDEPPQVPPPSVKRTPAPPDDDQDILDLFADLEDDFDL